jgi:exosortase/archaeosortase family protein
MQVVASITVEILNWIDIPALQHGNLIEISKGTLGVDEACSGIRSFQSTLMAGLLMGELYRLRLLPRAALVLIGLTLAFCFNVVRTFLLSYQAEKEGMSAIDKWHDPAGFTIAIATFLCLWAIAVFVTKRWSVKSPQSPVSGPQSTVPDAPLTSDLRPLTSGRTRRCLAAVGIWSLVCIGLTEAWYRSHHLNRADTAQWWVTYPTNLPSFQPIKVPPTSAKLLKHDMENGGSWTEPDGTKWSVFCFRWKEGDPAARMSAQGHRPEYCLVGSGHEMKSMSDIKFIEANGLNFPFRFYTFNSSGQPMHVFFCLWEDGAEKQDGFGKSKQGDRLRTVLAGRRGMGQQTLEIICTGYQDMEAAEKALRQRLPEIIRIEAQAPKTQAAAK